MSTAAVLHEVDVPRYTARLLYDAINGTGRSLTYTAFCSYCRRIKADSRAGSGNRRKYSVRDAARVILIADNGHPHPLGTAKRLIDEKLQVCEPYAKAIGVGVGPFIVTYKPTWVE